MGEEDKTLSPKRFPDNLNTIPFEVNIPAGNISGNIFIRITDDVTLSIGSDEHSSLFKFNSPTEQNGLEREKRRVAALHPDRAPRHIRREGIESKKWKKCPFCGNKMERRYCNKCKKNQPKMRRVYDKKIR